MAPTSVARSATSGRYVIVAVSVARLTFAVSTPGVRIRKRSMRFTHDAQVMPSICSSSCAGCVDAVILPGSIASGGCARLTGMDPRATVWVAIAGPRGPVHVAATTRGVVAVEQLTTDDAFIASLRRRLGGPVEPAGAVAPTDPRRRRLTAGLAALESVLSGHPPMDAPVLDLADRPDWDRRVLSAVAEIPWGRTAS